MALRADAKRHHQDSTLFQQINEPLADPYTASDGSKLGAVMPASRPYITRSAA
jgi:hypothetical protein